MVSLKHFCQLTFIALFFVVCSALPAAAQQKPALVLPRPSQKASVMQTVGMTDITITYSRPGVKGRKIWGDATPAELANVKGAATLDNQNLRPQDAPIVPYAHVWRTGANEATVFTVTDDVLVNGQKLAAGTYSLHTIPSKDGDWTIIFNSDAGQWGSFTYDEKKDVLRVKAKPQTVADNQEWLNYDFPTVTANSAQAMIRWEKLAVPFTIEVPSVEAVMLKKVNAAMAADPADWNTPLSVAGQYAGDNKWETAIAWADKSIKVKETFQNLSAKANYLAASGHKPEAIALGEKAVAQGKTDKADTARFEKRLDGWKTGKM